MQQVELNKNKSKKSGIDKFLDGLERVANKIPEPMVLFLGLSVLVLIASAILSAVGFQDVHPMTKEPLKVVNLLSPSGIGQIIANAKDNFGNFAPLSTVLVAMLGVGFAEKTGLFTALLSNSAAKLQKGSAIKVAAILCLISIVGNAAGDSAMVIMPAIGAMVFAAAGRNPVAGMFCAYATVAGAFSANLIPTSLDVLLVGFTEAGAKVGTELTGVTVNVNPMMNYYFQAVSTIFLTIVSTWVTVKIVEPRLGKYNPGKDEVAVDGEVKVVTAEEKKGLKWAGIALVIFLLVIVALAAPANGLLRDPKTHSPIASSAPLMKGLVFIIALAFFIPGVVFGKVSGKIKGSKDIQAMLGQAMSDMGPYIALVFFMAQFVNFFAWSNLGSILAIKGANFLKASGFPVPVVMVLLIVFCAVIDIFLGSASAKWAIMAPIFVPMFMMLGYHPSLIVMTYRIGDSIINVITPLLPYFAMMLALARKYKKDAGMGTLIAGMLPYTLAFFVFWTILLLVWYFLGLPMGPGSPLLLK